MEQALQYLRGLRGTPLIAFIGLPCRTWYADEHVICAVMEILRQERMFQPVHTDPRGFDFTIKTIADRLGLVSVETNPGGRDEEGRSIRDPEMLDGVEMVVAFPEEKPGARDELGRPVKAPNEKRQSWKTADPALAEIIVKMGLPVLAVYRDGETIWVSKRGET
jgi:hypothetical protein